MNRRQATWLLDDVIVMPTDLEGYTHDIAAQIVKTAQHEHGLSKVFHIVADERGFGPITWRVEWQSVLVALEHLANIGAETLRFLPDGGIEFFPIPESERVDWVAEVKKISDANKGA